MECLQLQGVESLTLYEYKNIRFNYPNPADDTTYDFLSWTTSSSDGYFIEHAQKPLIERENSLNNNYFQSGNHKITFWIPNEDRIALQQLKEMQENRFGFLPEFVMLNGDAFCFDAPYFVSEVYKKASNENITIVTLKTRVKSNVNQLWKTNSLPTLHSYILLSDTVVMGMVTNNELVAITSNY